MSFVDIANVLFRRQRGTFLTVAVLGIVAAAAIVFALPKEYDAKATLFLAENRPLLQSGTNPQSDEALARSYGELLGSPLIAREAARSLSSPLSVDQVAGAVDFKFLTGTRLIEVSATARDPREAQAIANAYARAFIANRRRVAAESSRTELANLDAEIRRLVLDRRRLERSPDAEAEAELAEVENRLDAAREASQTISQTAALEADRVSLSSPAFAPGAPARPKPALYLLVAVLFALALATVAALLRNTFDERVRDDDELSELLGAPIVAQIPESRDVDSRRDGLFREAFNFLNANVHVGDPGRALRTVAITSPVPEVGKTTVVRELSRSLTSGRRRVVAVEADLRKPKLTKYMAMRNGRSGLASLLTQGGDPRPLLQWADHGLALLPPGRPLPPDPAGLFDPDRFEDVLERLSQQADYVLVDTAPVLAAPETSTITALVDRVLIVVTPGASRRRTLTATRNQLQQSGANVVGIVVNRIPRREQQYEYYYSPLAVLDGGDPEAEPSPTSSPSPHRTNP